MKAVASAASVCILLSGLITPVGSAMAQNVANSNQAPNLVPASAARGRGENPVTITVSPYGMTLSFIELGESIEKFWTTDGANLRIGSDAPPGNGARLLFLKSNWQPSGNQPGTSLTVLTRTPSGSSQVYNFLIEFTNNRPSYSLVTIAPDNSSPLANRGTPTPQAVRPESEQRRNQSRRPRPEAEPVTTTNRPRPESESAPVATRPRPESEPAPAASSPKPKPESASVAIRPQAELESTSANTRTQPETELTPAVTRPQPELEPTPASTRTQPEAELAPAVTRPQPEPEPTPVAARPQPEPQPAPAAARPQPEPQPAPVATNPQPKPQPAPAAATPQPKPATTRVARVNPGVSSAVIQPRYTHVYQATALMRGLYVANRLGEVRYNSVTGARVQNVVRRLRRGENIQAVAQQESVSWSVIQRLLQLGNYQGEV